MALVQCLQKLWTQYRGSHKVALVQSAETRAAISYVQIYQWQEELRRVLPQGAEWLVVGINVTPCSIEESVAMLLVAQEPHWTYVPIDAALSVSKQLDLLQRAGVHQLVTTATSALFQSFSQPLQARAVTLGTRPFRPINVMDMATTFSSNNQPLHFHSLRATNEAADAPLNVLFTSGTTGEPRGVMGSRGGAWTRMTWMWTHYPFLKRQQGSRPRERVLRATKLSFVDSVWEILGAFLQQVPLIHLQAPRSRIDTLTSCAIHSVVLDNSARFITTVCREHVTRCTIVPSVLALLMLQLTAAHRLSALRQLRYILSSGEALQLNVVRDLAKHVPTVTILNLYGSTEVSGDVLCMALNAPILSTQVDFWQRHGVPIATLSQSGVVSDATSLWLVPEDGSDKIPLWPRSDAISDRATMMVTGVLYVSGPLLSHGYLSHGCNRNTCVATKQPPQWVCMGDICSVIQGHVYYCGRTDHAVKINGQRVYLEAVEAAVAKALQETGKGTRSDSFQQVLALTTMAQETQTSVAFRHARIVACIVDADIPRGIVAPYWPTRTLKAWISAQYGTLHTPHDVFSLSWSTVPLLANGKIDRHALGKMVKQARTTQLTSWSTRLGPEGSMARRIVVMLSRILDVSLLECVSKRAQTFAEVGGNSLLATLLQHELRQAFGTLHLRGQDVLHMTIEAIWSVQHAHSTTELHNHGSSKGQEPPLRAEELRHVDVERQKKKHTAPVIANATFARDDRERLTFLARGNQSSLAIQNMYLPLCYLSSFTLSGQSWNLQLAWRVDLGKCIDASPLVVQRHGGYRLRGCSTWAIIGSHSGQLVCVDVLAAGHELWRVHLDDRIEASAAVSVQQELVYVGTYAGSFFALDLASGKTRWTYQAKSMIKASALVLDPQNLVLCGSYDHTLYALDATVGHVQWQINLYGSIFSPPFYCACSCQLFVATTNGHVSCLSLSSSVARDCHSVDIEWKLQLSAPVFAGLTVDITSKTLLVGCADGKLFGVNTTLGTIQWQVPTAQPIFSSPCVYRSGSVVFGSHDGKVRKVKARTGEVVWTTNVHGAVFSSPTVVRLVTRSSWTLSHASKLESQLVCCVTTTTGLLCFCDEATGSIVYQTGDASGQSRRSGDSCVESTKDLGPLFGSPVMVDNFCLVGTRTNDFYGFQLTPTHG